jgi:hypothetical protein
MYTLITLSPDGLHFLLNLYIAEREAPRFHTEGHKSLREGLFSRYSVRENSPVIKEEFITEGVGRDH